MNLQKHYEEHYLSHAGKKGMKWGYTDGSPNGKRTATTTTIDAETTQKHILEGSVDNDVTRNLVSTINKEVNVLSNKVKPRGKAISPTSAANKKLVNYVLSQTGVLANKVSDEARKRQKRDKAKQELKKRWRCFSSV